MKNYKLSGGSTQGGIQVVVGDKIDRSGRATARRLLPISAGCSHEPIPCLWQ